MVVSGMEPIHLGSTQHIECHYCGKYYMISSIMKKHLKFNENSHGLAQVKTNSTLMIEFP